MAVMPIPTCAEFDQVELICLELDGITVADEPMPQVRMLADTDKDPVRCYSRT